MVSKLKHKNGCALVALFLLLNTSGCHLKSRDSNSSSKIHSLSHPATGQGQTNTMERKLMSIWWSPKSTPQERAEALNKWLSTETSIETAISLLGSDGIVSRDHGPSAVLTSGKNGAVVREDGFYEKFWLKYEMPNGFVNLSFDNNGGASREWKFEHAYVSGEIVSPKSQ